MIDGIERESGLERRVRAVLEESLTRVDARTRSRLNRARQAALEAAAARRRSLWPRFGLLQGPGVLLPTAGVLAAAVLAVALALFMRGSFHSAAESAQPSIEVLDMLADDDGIAFMENYDHSFYEWAAAQEEASAGDASGSPAGAGGTAAGGASLGASG